MSARISLLALFCASTALGQGIVTPTGSGSSSGTNTGDVTVGAVGSTPNANGVTLTGQLLNLQTGSGSTPGLLSATDWTTFNNKAPTASPTFTGTVTAAAVTTTGTVTLGNGQHLQLGAAADFCSGNGAGTITCAAMNVTNNSNIGGAVDITGGFLARCGGTSCKFGATGTAFTASYRGSATLDFAIANIATCSADLTITVTGAVANSDLQLNVPNVAMVTGSHFQAWVSANDTVSVRHCCIGAATCDPASGTFYARVTLP